jgi:hypothetical protein
MITRTGTRVGRYDQGPTGILLVLDRVGHKQG